MNSIFYNDLEFSSVTVVSAEVSLDVVSKRLNEHR